MLPRTLRPQVAAGGSYRAIMSLPHCVSGVPTNFVGDYTQLNMLKKTINPQIDKAVGDKLIGEYWSGNEQDSLDMVWHVDVTTPSYGAKLKTNTYKVRAVLAF